ncbi:Crp/Fnr family transcriptional regulator [Tamlana nanhaiensis]|uniref:Crp/Fnr family transcriptional regulator n=1 Tax=Neotamlana nanhaiensis TaxID=1382798 RepID=A0A0D7WAK6_9FLAO|nr:Crp/Fnr family transcriptional regulator [Tamlana nanhaiensis]KJD34757.1 Crp/Fnr family transcriptional regulator [Tamlana nanhaiensis]
MSLALKNHIEKIVSLTDEEFKYVLSFFTKKKLQKHQFLIASGAPVQTDHFVLKGLLKATYTNDEGKQHILQFAMEDWWVTDYQAYFLQTNATLNIDCLENSEVLCLTLENREKLCRELQKIEHFFRIKTSMGFVAQQQRILSLLNKDAKGRYNQLLEQYPQLLQRVPKTILAAYLGVTRETLSRL